jgi:hypothetical protein
MKTRGISCLAAIAILLTLTACAGPEITPLDVAMEQARVQVEQQQVASKYEADKAEYEMLAQLPPETAGIAYMGKQMREMVTAVLAKDGRKQAGFYDMKTAVAASQNAMAERLTGRILSTTVTGVGIYAAADVIKHGQDRIGDTINASGEGSAVEVNRISSKSNTDTNQVGDGNSTGAVDASTVGPDKSSTVTEVVAPEEPVVEEPEVEEPEEGEFVPTEPPAEFDDIPIDIPEVPEEAK